MGEQMPRGGIRALIVYLCGNEIRREETDRKQN
jgi:hypothetical protein